MTATVNAVRNTLSESAFLTSEMRARRVEVSQDVYAHLWVTGDTKKLLDEYVQVSLPWDPIEGAVRNRWHLENLQRYVNPAEPPVFVNLGAGFTSYSLLFPHFSRTIEADLPAVIQYKQEKYQDYLVQRLIPAHAIEFQEIDLDTTAGLDKLEQQLGDWITGKPSFLILEGVSAYLKPESLQRLFRVCATLQQPGSFFAFDFWEPSVVDNGLYLATQEFWRSYFDFADTRYNLIDLDYLQAFPEYRVLEHTEAESLAYRYIPGYVNSQRIFPEHYVLVQRV